MQLQTVCGFANIYSVRAIIVSIVYHAPQLCSSFVASHPFMFSKPPRQVLQHTFIIFPAVPQQPHRPEPR